MRRALRLSVLISAGFACRGDPVEPSAGLSQRDAAPPGSIAQVAATSTTYTVTFLGFLGGGSNTSAQDGNSSGVIVGEGETSTGENHAYRWTAATGMQELGTLTGGVWSNAITINESGVIVGETRVTATGLGRAMRWTEVGGMQDLGLLPTGTHSRAIDVNELGQIVGFADVNGNDHAYLWTEAGGMQDLGTFLGGTTSRALDINNVGQVVGHGTIDASVNSPNHAFVWTQAGGFQDLGLLPGWQESRAFDINDDGVVVGYGSLPTGSNNWQAFRWTAAAGLVALPHLPTGNSSKAVDINENGEVSGWDRVGGNFRAVVWPPSGGVVDLGCLAGTTVGKGYGITGKGVVAGECSNHATIWTPGSEGGNSIAIDAGNNQSAAVGTAVAPPSVKVTDGGGNPVAGVAITFAVTAGGGSVTGSSQTTDAGGIATAGSWTLGTTAGTGNNALSATSTGFSGSPVTFTASATPGPASAATSTATVPNGAVGSPTTITVQARDQFANNLTSGGATVAVAVTGANAASPAVTDDGNGAYSTSYTPTAVGTDQVAITLDGTAISGSPYPSTISGGTAKTIALNTGNNQSATVGTPVATPPSVKVTDAGNNPVAGVAVTFAVTVRGGSLTGATATTDASGIATVGSWTLGTKSGTNKLTATAAGLTGSPVTFIATGMAGPPTQIVISAGDNQTAPAGTTLPKRPAVKLTDAFGNGVPTVAVTFVVASGGGSITKAFVKTGSGGVATAGSWTLGVVPGPNTLQATASGAGIANNPVTFIATGT
jgi:probable HAF family extracellular repeat protein